MPPVEVEGDGKGPKRPLGTNLGSALRFNLMSQGILLEQVKNSNQTSYRQIR